MKALCKNFKGLTNTQLKIIGIILMIFDHVHQMFYMKGIPIWFKILGRMVAPIFLYLLAEGYYYTKNKEKYMLRLWIGFVLMKLCNNIVQIAFPLESVQLMNSMFGTLFLGLFYMWVVDYFKSAFKEKNFKSILMGISWGILPFAVEYFALLMLNENLNAFRLITTLMPTPFLTEGGIIWIFLSVCFYLLRNQDKKIQLLPLAIISIFFFLSKDFLQSTMALAIIPIGLYNGQLGNKGAKYFFYIFYPLHIYLLYMVSYMIQ